MAKGNDTEPMSAPAESSNQSTAMVVAAGTADAAEQAQYDRRYVEGLERENRQLKLMVHSPAGSALTAASAGAGSSMQGKYRVDRLSEGFWDGLYRARCGFRVIGLYETEQEAWHEASLDHAVSMGRVRRLSSSGPAGGGGGNSHGNSGGG